MAKAYWNKEWITISKFLEIFSPKTDGLGIIFVFGAKNKLDPIVLRGIFFNLKKKLEINRAISFSHFVVDDNSIERSGTFWKNPLNSFFYFIQETKPLPSLVEVEELAPRSILLILDVTGLLSIKGAIYIDLSTWGYKEDWARLLPFYGINLNVEKLQAFLQLTKKYWRANYAKLLLYAQTLELVSHAFLKNFMEEVSINLQRSEGVYLLGDLLIKQDKLASLKHWHLQKDLYPPYYFLAYFMNKVWSAILKIMNSELEEKSHYLRLVSLYKDLYRADSGFKTGLRQVNLVNCFLKYLIYCPSLDERVEKCSYNN